MLKLKKNILAALVLIVALSSCISEKKRLKICNSCVVKDSIVYKEVVKLKDTTIFITQQGPIQYLENPCAWMCDSLGLKPFEITKKENGIRTTVKSVGNSIAIESHADSLEKKVILAEKTISKDETKNIFKYIPCTNERTMFDGFCRYNAYLLWLLIVFFGVRYYLKWHKPFN